MRHRKIRKFRHRPSNRGYYSRDNGVEQVRVGSRQFSNGRSRNNFNQHQSPEKLAEKYSALAKEALSSGDKILSENYSQHADHFMRVIGNKNLNQNQINKDAKAFDDHSAAKDTTTKDIAAKDTATKDTAAQDTIKEKKE